jgi:hypothetical protein
MKKSDIVKPASVEDILFSSTEQRLHVENLEKEREERRVRMINVKPVTQRTMDRAEKKEPTMEQLNKTYTGLPRTNVGLKVKSEPKPIKTFTCPISGKTFRTELECEGHTRLARRKKSDERRQAQKDRLYLERHGCTAKEYFAKLRKQKHERVLARKRRRGGLTEDEYLRKHNFRTKFGAFSNRDSEYKRRMDTPGYRDSWLTSGAGPFGLSPKWIPLEDRPITETVQGLREEPGGDTRSMASILARSTPKYLANHPNWDKKRKAKTYLRASKWFNKRLRQLDTSAYKPDKEEAESLRAMSKEEILVHYCTVVDKCGSV